MHFNNRSHFVYKYAHNRKQYGVAQKTGTLCFVRLNFIKYWPILKLISLSDQENICNNTITKDPTEPQVCRYTTFKYLVKCDF